MLHFWKIQNLRATSPCFTYSYYSENYIQVFFFFQNKFSLFCLTHCYIYHFKLLFIFKNFEITFSLGREKYLLSFSIAAQCIISCMILTDVKVMWAKIYFYLFDFLFAKHTIRRLFLSFCWCFWVTSMPMKWVLHSHCGRSGLCGCSSWARQLEKTLKPKQKLYYISFRGGKNRSVVRDLD